MPDIDYKTRSRNGGNAQNQTGAWRATGKATGERYRYIEDKPQDGANANEPVAAAKTRSRPNSEYVLYSNGEPVAVNADGDTSYFGTDILGSVRSVTDKYGNVKASYEYDALSSEDKAYIAGQITEKAVVIYASAKALGSLKKASKGGTNSTKWQRNLQNIDELDVKQFKNLKNNGTVKVNSSGSNRSLYSEPNSFYSTGNGEHIFVYDENGKLIYDLSSQRVKGFKINTNPTGKEFFQDYKLNPVGEIPDEIREIFGW